MRAGAIDLPSCLFRYSVFVTKQGRAFLEEARELTRKITRKALELGFARVGVTTADPVEGYEDELCRRHGYDLWNVADPDSKLRLAARPREKVRRFAQIAIEK